MRYEMSWLPYSTREREERMTDRKHVTEVVLHGKRTRVIGKVWWDAKKSKIESSPPSLADIVIDHTTIRGVSPLQGEKFMEQLARTGGGSQISYRPVKEQ